MKYQNFFSWHFNLPVTEILYFNSKTAKLTLSDQPTNFTL